MTEAGAPVQLHALPPSAKSVYRCLEYKEEATLTEICNWTYLQKRTAIRAVNRLDSAGLIDSRPGTDARQTVYYLDE